MFVQLVSLRKIPMGSLRLVMAAAAQDCGARTIIEPFVSPLPDIPYKVFDAERTGTGGMSAKLSSATHIMSTIRGRDSGGIPLVAPGVRSSVGTLGRILPFPLMRKPLTSPFRVGTSVVERNPCNRLVCGACWECPIGPIFQEVVSVLRYIAGSIHEFLELRVTHWVFIHIECVEFHLVCMMPARRIFSRVLDINADFV